MLANILALVRWALTVDSDFADELRDLGLSVHSVFTESDLKGGDELKPKR